jgi:arsenate reductase (glutaredoxin)
MQVQIFGTKKCPETRKAQRFFSERRIQIHFVDLKEKAASRGELLRFVQKFGVEALLDRDGRRFQDLGLATARYGEERWVERLVEDPALLRTPLVRMQQRLAIGWEEPQWREWLEIGAPKG